MARAWWRASAPLELPSVHCGVSHLPYALPISRARLSTAAPNRPTPLASRQLRVMDAFVVRYDAREQASLPMHIDENTFSFTIALNDQQEYEGGGTIFANVRPASERDGPYVPTILNANAGGVVTFPGKLPHGGNVVTQGAARAPRMGRRRTRRGRGRRATNGGATRRRSPCATR